MRTESATQDGARALSHSGPRLLAAAKPRVLFVNNTTYDLPLAPSPAKGWDAISERLDVRVIGRRGSVGEEDERFSLVESDSGTLGGRAFYARLLPLVVREARRFRPDVLATQSPYEAFALLPALRLLRPRPKLVVQVHADWRCSSRLYGGGPRRALAPLADRAAAAALRSADGVRAVGPYTARLAEEVTGTEPVGCYPGFFDLAAFSAPPAPLPSTPRIAWIAMLEKTKNLDGFVAAWRLVAERVPEARLTMVGQGRMQAVVDKLVRDYPGRVTAIPRTDPRGVAEVLDASTLLVLPSRSEGAGRVVMEAFARGRAVVGSRVGGIPDLVRPGHNGALVEPEDTAGLADALTHVLSDRALAGRLGTAAYDLSREFNWTPERLADELVEVVARMAGPAARSKKPALRLARFAPQDASQGSRDLRVQSEDGARSRAA